MRSNSREEVVEVFDALRADPDRALGLSFDALTNPELLAVRVHDVRRFARTQAARFGNLPDNAVHASLRYQQQVSGRDGGVTEALPALATTERKGAERRAEPPITVGRCSGATGVGGDTIWL